MMRTVDSRCQQKSRSSRQPQKMEQKLFPQNKHLDTASRNSSTTQLRAGRGSQVVLAEESESAPRRQLDGGRSTLRLQPVHVRSIGVDRMNVVAAQRPVHPVRTGRSQAQARERKKQ